MVIEFQLIVFVDSLLGLNEFEVTQKLGACCCFIVDSRNWTANQVFACTRVCSAFFKGGPLGSIRIVESALALDRESESG